ncbi:MAG: DNA polymerase III subunit delta [Methylococcus sp.]
MKLGLEQLDRHLQGKLGRAYVLSGDEPLQLMEAADAIRAAAKAAGYVNHERFHGDTGFDWNDFRASCDSFSLFGEPRLLDLRLPGKPEKAGSEALIHFAEQPPEDALLIVSLPKLTQSDQKVRWFQALERVGVVVQVWPLEGEKLLRWLDRRLNSRGLLADQSGLRLLAARVEGNLLAAAQEIEKLQILHGAGQLSDEQILKSVADSARYDVFDLADQVLRGQAGKACRVLAGLRAEGIAAPVVLWALTRELRLLNQMKIALEEGAALDAVFAKHRIWDNRKPVLQQALKRLSRDQLRQSLLLAGKADWIIKGQEPGDDWDALLTLCLAMIKPGA